MPRTRGPVLVVGATRILAPAARALVAAGDDVLAVARGAAGLAALREELGPRVRTLAADAREPTLVDRLVEALPGDRPADPVLGAALLYGPAVSPGTVELVATLAEGPVVLVLTSQAADPGSGGEDPWRVTALPAAPPGVRRLVLGWRPDGTWHTPAEISAAAVTLAEGKEQHDALLGVVRPWSGRPR